MKKPIAFVVLLVCAFSAGCGKKGPLLPPLIRTPQKVEAVTLFQRGDKIFVKWKNPVTYVDGAPLDAVAEVEIWVLEQPKGETAAVQPAIQPAIQPATQPATQPAIPPAIQVTADYFEAKARPAAVIERGQLTTYRKEKDSDAAGFSYPYSLADKKIGVSKFIFAVRVKDRRSHESAFSPTAEIEPQTSPLPPQGLELRSIEDKICLAWQAPAANVDMSTLPRVAGYNVYRESKDDPVKLLNSSLVKELKYEDGEFEYGLPLRYFVRSSATETAPYLESDDSERREIVPKDVFPPAAPIGLVPVTGKGFIALSWEANREKDFAGYKVWRRVEGEAEDKLLTPQLIIENAYTDAEIEKGRRYRYAISSVDRNGNESPRTEVVADSLKDGP
jgi:predicted small lipoprotein YifL